MVAIAFMFFSFLQKAKKETALAINAILREISLEFGETYFFSMGIYKAVKDLLLLGGKRAEEAFYQLNKGKVELARDYLAANGKTYSAAVLSSLFNHELGEEMFRSLRKSDMADLQLAYLYLVQGRKEKAAELLNGINLKKINNSECAIFYYCRAKLALDNGDLYNASIDVAESIKIFHKNNSFFEEAKAYILSGEIYRISALVDMAYFMYEEAKKIAEKHHLDALKADVLGSIGMLMTMQERFSVAHDVFFQALEINREMKRDEACACLYNQLGLLKLLDKKYGESTDYINLALSYAILEANAFSFELMAKVNFEKGKYEETVKCAHTAQKKYWKCNNLTAYFESMYLEALSLFNLKKYQESEGKIRHLLDIANENESAFHTANAYSLLGSICMKREKFSSAKTFFEEAIRHELRNGRAEGMVSDYLNLGIIARNCGDEEGAQMNFNEAQRYANEAQNDELCEIVKKYINEA